MHDEDWVMSVLKEADYIGWRGLGPRLGTRYFANVCDGYVILIAKYTFGGLQMHFISNLAVIEREIRKPSMFYITCTTLLVFQRLGDMIDVFKAATSIYDVAVEISIISLVIVFGILIDWLFDRPRMDVMLEGGIRVGVYSGFNKRLAGLIKNASRDRGHITTESGGASSKYFVYLTRADKTPLGNRTIRRIFRYSILTILWIVVSVIVIMAVFIYIIFFAEKMSSSQKEFYIAYIVMVLKVLNISLLKMNRLQLRT